MKFTKQQIADYVTGWLPAGKEKYSVTTVKAMLHNAKYCLEDNQDGIKPFVKEQNNYFGFTLVKTCDACPEQYDVYRGDQMVAYFRLRHGHFTARVPDVEGGIVYESNTIGDGCFEPEEREKELTKACESVYYELQSYA
ncbi:hypothetical protein N9955_00420 [bacterium]|nr:hypothetical protein [bacterium]